MDIPNITLRTEETEKIYQQFLQVEENRKHCPFCNLDLLVTNNLKYPGWAIIENRFPYDKVFQTHHMLCTLEHTSELTKQRKKEFEDLLLYLEPNYDMYIYNTREKQTIPRHFHIHLVNFYK